MALSRTERDRLEVLERRIEHLNKVLDDWQGHDPGRVIAERSALVWAVDFIKQHQEAT